MVKYKDGLIAAGGNIEGHQIGFMVIFDNNAKIPCMITDEVLKIIFNWTATETKEQCFEKNKEVLHQKGLEKINKGLFDNSGDMLTVLIIPDDFSYNSNIGQM